MVTLLLKKRFLGLLVVASCSNNPSEIGHEIKSIKPEENKTSIDMEVEQAVIVNFNYGINGLDSLFELEEQLEKVINENKLGEYDGNEVAIDYSDGTLFMYGPDAEKLFSGIRPVLERTSFMKGAKVKLRFGPPEDGVKEINIDL